MVTDVVGTGIVGAKDVAVVMVPEVVGAGVAVAEAVGDSVDGASMEGAGGRSRRGGRR